MIMRVEYDIDLCIGSGFVDRHVAWEEDTHNMDLELKPIVLRILKDSQCSCSPLPFPGHPILGVINVISVWM